MTKPPIGIEIELPWATMLARVDQEAAGILSSSNGFWGLQRAQQDRVQLGFTALDELYKDVVLGQFGNDIAPGNDGFAEFAFRPKHEHKEIVELTEGLYDLDLLRRDEEYPLHVTLGDVPLTQSSWLILMCMELAGGTTSTRITQTRTWDRKGRAGILRREPHELQLGSVEGFEMRSLSLTSPESLGRTLRIAQGMGGLLVDKICDDTSAKHTWNDIYRFMMRKTVEVGIDASYAWPNPTDDITPWAQTSEALNNHIWRNSIESDLNTVV